MKHKIAIVFITLLIAAVFSSCGQKESPSKAPTAYCAICGEEATESTPGTLSIFESWGIPQSKCKKISDFLYSIDVCDACITKYSVKPGLGMKR